MLMANPHTMATVNLVHQDTKTTILQKQALLDMHIAVDMAEVREMTDIMTITCHTVITTTFRLEHRLNLPSTRTMIVKIIIALLYLNL
jgi:hypothetical protein